MPWFRLPFGHSTAHGLEGTDRRGPGRQSGLHAAPGGAEIAPQRAALGDGTPTWDGADDSDVLSVSRFPGFGYEVNRSDNPLELPAHGEVLPAGGPCDGDPLPSDRAVWLSV
ncbi:hypothetical protein ACFU5O_25160 [Streptomyces sp. NPDC057445]|uniref:hypothetical protein n=1 Tax=Streptomyces sp. NPDC057445 TaxID=3346136 RepID=UPI003673AEF4